MCELVFVRRGTCPRHAFDKLHSFILLTTEVAWCSAYTTYQSASEGQLQGVGLLLASDPGSNRVVVAAPIANSPAERAGLRRGDILIAIDGQNVDADTDAAGQLLRGQIGTEVSLSFVRFTGGYTPGVAARAPAPRSGTNALQPRPQSSAPDGSLDGTPLTNVSWPGDDAAAASGLRTVTLQRAPVRISSVVSSRLPMRGQPIGYIRLSQFNSTAPQDMQEAVEGLKRQGVRGFILDLRDNPGGLVGAGMLRPPPTNLQYLHPHPHSAIACTPPFLQAVGSCSALLLTDPTCLSAVSTRSPGMSRFPCSATSICHQAWHQR